MSPTNSNLRPFSNHNFVEWVDTAPSYDFSFPEKNVIAFGPDFSLFPQVFEWLGGRNVFTEAEAEALWVDFYLSEPFFLIDLLGLCRSRKYLLMHSNGKRFTYVLTGDQSHLRLELTRILKSIAKSAIQSLEIKLPAPAVVAQA